MTKVIFLPDLVGGAEPPSSSPQSSGCAGCVKGSLFVVFQNNPIRRRRIKAKKRKKKKEEQKKEEEEVDDGDDDDYDDEEEEAEEEEERKKQKKNSSTSNNKNKPISILLNKQANKPNQNKQNKKGQSLLQKSLAGNSGRLTATATAAARAVVPVFS